MVGKMGLESQKGSAGCPSSRRTHSHKGHVGRYPTPVAVATVARNSSWCTAPLELQGGESKELQSHGLLGPD